MRKLVLGLVLGAALASAATTFATSRKPECVSYDADTRACTLRDAEEYLVDVPGLDLQCLAHVRPTDDDATPYMSCYRRTNYNRCVRGHSRSLTAVITPTRMTLRAADRCAKTSGGIGFRVTRVGRDLVGYRRSP